MLKKSHILLLIMTIGLITYSNTVFHDFVWDDLGEILQNEKVHSISNIPKLFLDRNFQTVGVFYRPVKDVVISIFYSIFGPTPFFYHLFLILLHLANSGLSFLLFRKFFQQPVAVLLSLIFLAHPMNVEVVAYVSSLNSALFVLFGLSALLIAISKTTIRYSNLLISLLLMLSILSKETGLLFLGIILFYKLIVAKKELVPFIYSSLTVLFVYGLLRLITLPSSFDYTVAPPIANLELFNRIVHIPHIISFYLTTFIYPNNLIIDQKWIIKSISFSDFYWPLTLIGIFTLTMIACIIQLQKQIEGLALFLFFLLWFILGLSINLQIIPLTMTVADRWFYLPMIGLLGIIGVILNQITFRTKYVKLFFLLTGILLISILCVRTMYRNFQWKNNKTLFLHDVKYAKNSGSLLNNAGLVLLSEKNYADAQYYFNQAVTIDPKQWKAYNNLAIIDLAQNATSSAKHKLASNLEITTDPIAYENYAKFLLKHEPPEVANNFVLKVQAIYPSNINLLLILIETSQKINNREQASLACHKTYKIRPTPEIKNLCFQIDTY